MPEDNFHDYITNAIATARKVGSLPMIAGDIHASARVSATIKNLEGLRSGIEAVPAKTSAKAVLVEQRVDDSMAELQRVLASIGSGECA
ncbi:hypothetical protein EB73_03425 [Mycobacterium sp. SWH-M3]|nr:hypothetical protein EB73_03425 [Mycobacterium sp. SWH-M3]